MSIVLGKVFQRLCKRDCLCDCLDSWFLEFRVVVFIKVNFCCIAVSLSLLSGAACHYSLIVTKFRDRYIPVKDNEIVDSGSLQGDRVRYIQVTAICRST